jgi:hypothetical protein
VEIWKDEQKMETILPPQNKLVQDSEGNEKNSTQIQTPAKQM